MTLHDPNFKSATGTGFVTGLLGRGIQKSKSPAIHEGEARALGFPLIYSLIDFDALGLQDEAVGEMVHYAARLGYRGLNVTHPLKQKILPFLDELSDDARLIGAVNTVVIKDGRLTGHNTDWYGFAKSCDIGLPGTKKTSVLQLGAGGAGAALCYALLRMGAQQLHIYDPDTRQVDNLKARFAGAFPTSRIDYCSNPAAILDQVDGVVQASPIGMVGHPGIPMNPEGLQARHWVHDIIYVPSETEFLQAARARGCQTRNGEGMVVLQAAEAFRLFTGVAPDSERMLEAFGH